MHSALDSELKPYSPAVGLLSLSACQLMLYFGKSRGQVRDGWTGVPDAVSGRLQLAYRLDQGRHEQACN